MAIDVCVMDFGGSYRMKDGTRIYPFNCWADWNGKEVVFGGAYRDVPNMPAEKEPSEDELDNWVRQHWTEEDWYPKYKKALEALYSTDEVQSSQDDQ